MPRTSAGSGTGTSISVGIDFTSRSSAPCVSFRNIAASSTVCESGPWWLKVSNGLTAPV